MKTLDIKSNTQPWKHCTNRHPTTPGNAWGWIEGAPGNVTWSNDNGSAFNSTDAADKVAAHNRWLEDCRPVELKLIDARNEAFALQQRVNSKRADLKQEEEKLEAVHQRIRQLNPNSP